MSIRARLLLLVLVATLVPAILLGIRFYHNRTDEIAAARLNLSTLTQSIARDLDETVQGTAQLHYGLARARDLDTRDKAACSAFLSAVREKHPQYTGILTIDPDGNLFCDSLKTGRVLDLRDRDYFKNALAATERVILEPAFGRLTGISVLQSAYPVRSETGQLKFILLASLNLQKFASNHHQRLPRGMELLLVDKKGTALAWLPDEERGKLKGTTLINAPLFQFASAAPGPRNRKITGLDGNDYFWATAAASAAPDPGLYVMVGVAKHRLVAEANRRMTEDMTILALVSLLLFGGVWALAELGIRRQVGRIAAMAAALGRGDLSTRILPPHPRGELGELMTVLNGTAESLERQRAAIAELDQKLRMSQKMESLGHLTGGIAHDFNNLLTVILGNAEILTEKLAKDERLRALAEMTRNAALRGAALTSRLLAFGRRQALNPKATDINKLILGMDGLLRRTLGEQIEVEVVNGGGLWTALIDAAQLESAVLNLCINARDAMHNGGRLTIETANVRFDATYAANQVEVEPGQYVMIAVSDSGTGMDAETLARAFDPFFTTKDVGKGSGLGLSMVYGFVKQSKGHVRIYSEMGHGTTVKLYLPRAGEHPESTDDKPNAAIEQGNGKILLVEDDDLVRNHAEAQLKTFGYDVVAARNGPEALRILSTAVDFDLLFTDIVMPGGMSGRQLAEEAAKLRPNLPVLFTSGYTENAVLHHDRLDRGVHLLQKPYRGQELAAKIRAVLDAERRRK